MHRIYSAILSLIQTSILGFILIFLFDEKVEDILK